MELNFLVSNIRHLLIKDNGSDQRIFSNFDVRNVGCEANAGMDEGNMVADVIESDRRLSATHFCWNQMDAKARRFPTRGASRSLELCAGHF
jgi:hypothetical protein